MPLSVAAYVLYVDAVKHPNLTKMVLAEEIFVVSALITGGVSAGMTEKGAPILGALFWRT